MYNDIFEVLDTPEKVYLNRLLAVYGFRLDTLTLRRVEDEKK